MEPSNWVSLDEIEGLEVGAIFIDNVMRHSVESPFYYLVTKVQYSTPFGSGGPIEYVECLRYYSKYEGDVAYASTSESGIIDTRYFQKVNGPPSLLNEIRAKFYRHIHSKVNKALLELQHWTDVQFALTQSK